MELDRNALEQQKVDLKLALKTWEAQFIAENGRKAGRDDIKANPPMGTTACLTLGETCTDMFGSSEIQRVPQDPGHTVWQSHVIQTEPEETETRAAGNRPARVTLQAQKITTSYSSKEGVSCTSCPSG